MQVTELGMATKDRFSQDSNAQLPILVILLDMAIDVIFLHL